MPVARLRQLAPMIQKAGLQISAELGYQPPARIPTDDNRRAEARLAKMAV